jgi:DNA-binding NarL/FixJ family response regulator
MEVLRPDVILAAVPLDELTAPAEGFAPPVVWLAADSQSAWTRDALRAGVRAVLPQDSSAAEILSAVAAAANGLAVLDPRDLEALLAAPVATVTADPPVLTPRELEVLRMMAEGEANKSIAWKLGISEHTAKFHVASILTKLDAGSRAEAVAIGIRKGMILL